MKSFAYKSLAVAGILSSSSWGMSLYDTAPFVGIPESYAIRYTANVGVGYDDNVNSTKDNRKGSMYYNIGVGASYADNESVDKLSYNAHLGATIYAKNANSSDQKFFSDSSLGVNFSHGFAGGSVYSAGLSLRYMPEPDYANGISAARSQGDCFTWNVTNSYAEPIDSRWGWSASCSYSGTTYTTTSYRYDNRQYISGSLALHYKESQRRTYSLTGSYRDELREYGLDSQSVYLLAGVNQAIDSISSFSVNVGAQYKIIEGDNSLYPSFRMGYNRMLAEGLSARMYASYDNENVDSYIYRSGNYRSSETWRVGMDFSYRLSPMVTFFFGGSLYNANYQSGTNGLPDSNRITWNLNAGIGYQFTESLVGRLSYNYTQANKEAGDYYRNRITGSLTYTF